MIEIPILTPGRKVSSNGQVVEMDSQLFDDVLATYDPQNFKAPLIISHDTFGRDDASLAESELAYGYPSGLKRVGNKIVAMFDRVAPRFRQWWEDGQLLSVSPSLYRPDSPSNPYPGQWSLRHVAALGKSPPAQKDLGQPVGLKEFDAAGDELDWVLELDEFDQPGDGAVDLSDMPYLSIAECLDFAALEPIDQLEYLYDPIDFAAKRKGKGRAPKPKKCSKGKSCGGGCIAKTKTCRKDPPSPAVAAAANSALGATADGADTPAPSTAIVRYEGVDPQPSVSADPSKKYFDVDVPDPGTTKVELKELQKGLFDYYGKAAGKPIKTVKQLEKDSLFKLATADNPIDLNDNASIRTLYRRTVGRPADEMNPAPGPGVVNGINVMRNFLPWQTFGIDKPSTATRQDLKSGFRKVAKEHHPDVGGDRVVFERLRHMYDSLDAMFEMEERDAAAKAAKAAKKAERAAKKGR